MKITLILAVLVVAGCATEPCTPEFRTLAVRDADPPQRNLDTYNAVLALMADGYRCPEEPIREGGVEVGRRYNCERCR